MIAAFISTPSANTPTTATAPTTAPTTATAPTPATTTATATATATYQNQCAKLLLSFHSIRQGFAFRPLANVHNSAATDNHLAWNRFNLRHNAGF